MATSKNEDVKQEQTQQPQPQNRWKLDVWMFPTTCRAGRVGVFFTFVWLT